jgi:hypothetical protein
LDPSSDLPPRRCLCLLYAGGRLLFLSRPHYDFGCAATGATSGLREPFLHDAPQSKDDSAFPCRNVALQHALQPALNLGKILSFFGAEFLLCGQSRSHRGDGVAQISLSDETDGIARRVLRAGPSLHGLPLYWIVSVLIVEPASST